MTLDLYKATFILELHVLYGKQPEAQLELLNATLLYHDLWQVKQNKQFIIPKGLLDTSS